MSAVGPVDLASATARRPLTDVAEAFSAARLELVDLQDGRRIVLKHLPADGDWLTRATDGSRRIRRLWESGLLDRARPLVDHTIIDLRSSEGRDLVVMRDASADLLPPRAPVSRSSHGGRPASATPSIGSARSDEGAARPPYAARP